MAWRSLDCLASITFAFASYVQNRPAVLPMPLCAFVSAVRTSLFASLGSTWLTGTLLLVGRSSSLADYVAKTRSSSPQASRPKLPRVRISGSGRSPGHLRQGVLREAAHRGKTSLLIRQAACRMLSSIAAPDDFTAGCSVTMSA